MKMPPASCLSVFAIIVAAAIGLTAQTPPVGAAGTQKTPAYSESTPYVPPDAAWDNSAKKSDRKKKPPAANGAPGGVISDQFVFTVSVMSAKGEMVRGLSKSDFQVFVGDAEQTISSVDTGPPLHVVFLIDVSPSTADASNVVKKIVTDIVDGLRPDDRVMVIKFGSNVKVLSEFTTDRKVTAGAISRANMENGTALYNAVTELFQKHLSPPGTPVAIVLLSDGVDTVSRKSSPMSSLFEAEMSSSVFIPVFFEASAGKSVGAKSFPFAVPFPVPTSVTGVGMSPEERAFGVSYLNELIKLSGGRGVAYRPESPDTGVIGAKISGWLKSQYAVSITAPSAGVAATGGPTGRLPLRVRVNRPGLVVLAKGSYIQ